MANTHEIRYRFRNALRCGIDDPYERLGMALLVGFAIVVMFYAVGAVVVLAVGHSIPR